MVGDRHEFGERWSPQDGVGGSLKLGNLKVDVLGTVVLPSADGDRQGDPADRGRPGTWDDGVEGLVGGHQGGHIVSHALQGDGQR